jgi:hypothetical protein
MLKTAGASVVRFARGVPSTATEGQDWRGYRPWSRPSGCSVRGTLVQELNCRHL